MSDDNNGDGRANNGVTLPSGTNATYDASLSPFFLGRNGIINMPEFLITVFSRGLNGQFLSRTVKNTNHYSYLTVFTSVIWPSDYYNRTYAISLRCLVSTTNS